MWLVAILYYLNGSKWAHAHVLSAMARYCISRIIRIFFKKNKNWSLFLSFDSNFILNSSGYTFGLSYGIIG